MKKNKSLYDKNEGIASIFRGGILFLALISLSGFIWLNNQYYRSSERIYTAKQIIDKQIMLSNSFYPNYLRFIIGNDKYKETLKSLISQFDKYLVDGQTGEMPKLSDSQENIFSNIVNTWKELKPKLLQPRDQDRIYSEAEANSIISYVAAMDKTVEIDVKLGKLRNNLIDLKNGYSPHLPGYLANLSAYMSFKNVLTWLSILIISLFILCIILQFINSYKLLKRDNILEREAEDKNNQDQKSISNLMSDIENLSAGDLTIEAKVAEDFTGVIAGSINFAIESMREMVSTIIRTSDEIGSATKDTQKILQLFEKSSKEQSQQIEKSNTNVNRIADLLNKNADNSVNIARSSVDIAKEGRLRVFSMIKSMIDIRENIQDTSKRIKRLGESSQEISDIVGILKSIADQTNILSLNASIQAISAADGGKGFAVVANEIQQLAERSANATKKIEFLVKTIQADANEAIISMESSKTKVINGASIAEEAGQSSEKIESVSEDLASSIVEVSQDTRDAAGMVSEVKLSMGEISKLSQQSTKDVATFVQSIDDLEKLSISLKESVARFKLVK